MVWWLLPAANLVMPMLVIRELWPRGCAGESPRLVYQWWAWLIVWPWGGVLATVGVGGFDGWLMLALSGISGLMAAALSMTVAMRITGGLEKLDSRNAVLPEPETDIRGVTRRLPGCALQCR